MLIIEGPDMVGKTTLIDKLAPALGASCDKCGLPEANLIGQRAWLERWKPGVVMDRYFISEFIYGLICRNAANVSRTDAVEMNDILRQLGAMTIVVVATPRCYERILEDHYDPTREAFSRELCRDVNAAYYELFVERPAGGWRGYFERGFNGQMLQHVAVVDLDAEGNVDRNSMLPGVAHQVREWTDCLTYRQALQATGYARRLIAGARS
jgi:hypothetical protein